MSYFTDLSYIGLVAYFWASGIQTIAFVIWGQKAYPLQKWSRILQFLHILLYTTITIFREFNAWISQSKSDHCLAAFIVTVVYWTLLASSSTFRTKYSGMGGVCSSTAIVHDRLLLAWSNVSQHAMNSCFALFEILLTNAGPSPWSHIAPGLVLFACYLGVAYITHAAQGFYSQFTFT